MDANRKNQVIDHMQNRFEELPLIVDLTENNELVFEDENFEMSFGMERIVIAELDRYIKQYIN